MSFISPYGIRLGKAGKIETVPIVNVRVRSTRGKEVPGIFIIDSGATTTLMPSVDAEMLGLAPSSGKEVLIQGIIGQLLGFQHRITLVIGNIILRKVPVIFAHSSDVPRVLGREGIFPKFGIFFDEPRRRTAFLDTDKERRLINSIFQSKVPK